MTFLLSLISEVYTEDTKINLFIQSLDKPETRLTLIAIQVALKLDTVEKVINQAIDLEVKARLTEQPEVLDGAPMDLDTMHRGYGQQHNKPYSHENTRTKSYDTPGQTNNSPVQLRAMISLEILFAIFVEINIVRSIATNTRITKTTSRVMINTKSIITINKITRNVKHTRLTLLERLKKRGNLTLLYKSIRNLSTFLMLHKLLNTLHFHVLK